MTDNYREWVLELDGSRQELMQTVPNLQRALTFATLGAAVPIPGGGFARIPGVILRMPVDTGRARSSVNVSVGEPDTSAPPEGNYPAIPEVMGAAQRAKGAGGQLGLANLRAYQTVWITSSLVYMPILEFGGYPDPVQRGTWDKSLGQYVVKSAGGYSKQAPQGMFGITFREIQVLLRGRE